MYIAEYEYGTHYNHTPRSDRKLLLKRRELNRLEKKIKEDGALVTKEYVKGRENIYTHPAIGEYNKTATAANQTVATLMKIVTTMRADNETDAGSEILSFLRGEN
jgi:hypothetical protein